jgi:hypothetical protein
MANNSTSDDWKNGKFFPDTLFEPGSSADQMFLAIANNLIQQSFFLSAFTDAMYSIVIEQFRKLASQPQGASIALPGPLAVLMVYDRHRLDDAWAAGYYPIWKRIVEDAATAADMAATLAAETRSDESVGTEKN